MPGATGFPNPARVEVDFIALLSYNSGRGGITMVLAPTTEIIPLTVDAHGVLRVGNTRVTLDTVIAAFADGATAEEIVQQYPSLHLADVYGSCPILMIVA